MNKPIVSLATAFCLSASALMAQTAGNLTVERWNSLPASFSVLELQQEGIAKRAPDNTSLLAGAEWAPGQGDYYGVRMRGAVTAPVTGAYTFFIAGDDNTELYLSTDASRFNKKRIAWQHFWTGPKQWDKYATQRSETVYLTAGQKYYIEAQMMEWGGGDHLSIGWAYEAPVALQENAIGGTVVQAWAETNNVHTLDVEAGDIWGGSDRFAFKHRTWTGDVEFVARVSAMNNPSNWSKVGLMVRATLDANSAHAMMVRTSRNGMAFQRRHQTAAGSRHTGHGQTYEWVRLVRRGDVIHGYTSTDGKSWIHVGSDTLPGLPATVYVGMAATDNSGGNHVTATIEDLAFRPVTATEVIPAAQLESAAPDANDADDDNLPDDWETQNGLDPANAFGKEGQYGDFDNDGINNLTEYQLGTNPTQKDALLDGLTRERWENIGGIRITNLTNNRGRFLREPSEKLHVSNIDENAHGDLYATRYRGTVTAPVTGSYTFWLSGDDEAELWLSDGSVSALTNRYGKQKLAWIQDQRFGRDYTSDEDFDRFATQRSRTVHLTAGQHYYIEVLHKEGYGGDHVAVAWQVPGGQREVIPASAFSSDIPEDDDLDDDYLPAAWETQYGLNPADNGLTDARDGQYGDWDQDGLTNFEEYQLGTDPTNTDSDGDTLSDKEERDYYGTDPLVSNQIVGSLHTQMQLSQYVDASGSWYERANGSLVSTERRGVIDYSFTVASGQEGIFEIMVTGGAEGVVRSVEDLPLEFLLNGNLIGKAMLRSHSGASSSVKHLTPWLTAGSYTLRINHTNYRAARQLRLDEVTVTRLGGIDTNSNGIADWVEGKLANENRIVHLPQESITSPLCVEALTPDAAYASLSKTVVDPVTSLPAQESHSWNKGINNGIYANVPLNTNGTTELTVNLQSGAVTETRQVTWTATNMITTDTLTIRKGDSLKLTAWDGATANGTFTLTLGGQPVNDVSGSAAHQSATPYVHLFDTAGVHTFEAIWQPAGGGTSLTSTLAVTVLEADFGDGIDIMAWNQRTWETPGVGQDILVQADDTLAWAETTAAGASNRSFAVDIYKSGTRHTLARLPGGGAILDRGDVRGFYFASSDETSDATIVTQMADGTYLMRMTYVAENLPANARIRIRSYFQGTTFLNGGNELNLTASDFDQNGIAYVYMEWADGTSAPRMCHYIDVFLD